MGTKGLGQWGPEFLRGDGRTLGRRENLREMENLPGENLIEGQPSVQQSTNLAFRGKSLKKNLNWNHFQSAQEFRLGLRFTFQQDNNPKHTAKKPSNLVELEQIWSRIWKTSNRKVSQACRIITKKTLGCHCCQRCFNQGLGEGSELCKWYISVFSWFIKNKTLQKPVFALSLLSIVSRLMKINELR